MNRNTHFRPQRDPFRQHPTLHLNDHIHGPFSFLNPTQARYEHASKTTDNAGILEGISEEGVERRTAGERSSNRPASYVAYRWTSRNNRKGRHALMVKFAAHGGPYRTPPATSDFEQVLKGIWRMLTYYPVWDVSYLVATTFTVGSVVWVLNAFFTFYPTIHPTSEFPGEILYGGGITAFVGATIFELGSLLLMLEAVNENRTGCFGWAVEQGYDEHFTRGNEKGAVTRMVPSENACTHHHRNKKNLVGSHANIKRAIAEKPSPSPDGTPPGDKSWVWWPSSHELRSHYIHDLGFIACCAQMIGATVFWISGFTALPGINNKLSPGLTDGIYWTPQLIGGFFFVVSGTLFMIETQKHWWLPAPSQLGWHIGLWNLIGGLGFTLCPGFGLENASWAQFQAGCSTFWGSWAFLIGSVVQWYESLDKHPVEEAKES